MEIHDLVNKYVVAGSWVPINVRTNLCFQNTLQRFRAMSLLKQVSEAAVIIKISYIGLNWLIFRLAHVSLDMKHVLNTEWLASANRGHGHFPHYFWSSYEYFIHYQSEDSRAH